MIIKIYFSSGVSNNNPKYLEKKSDNLTNMLLKKQRSKSRKLRCFSKDKKNADPLVKIKTENLENTTHNSIKLNFKVTLIYFT